jgi:hypothetical protein
MNSTLGSPPLWAVAWANGPAALSLYTGVVRGITWRCYFNRTISVKSEPPYTLGRRLGGPQTQPEHCGEDNNILQQLLLLYWRHNPMWVLASSMVWRFRNSIFVCQGLVAPRLAPTWRTREYTSSERYPLTCLAYVALLGAYAPASIAIPVNGPWKPPLHDKAVVLEAFCP